MTRPALLESTGAVAESIGAILYGSGERPIRNVTIDSRTCGPGSLFVALPGENTDGHRFVADALRAGAACALIRSDWANRHRSMLEDVLVETEGAVCLVPDPLAGLQRLARLRLAALEGLTRIGITGSNGKTTTKELVASVLGRKARTFKTKGNFNSEIGIPLSVFEVEEGDEYGVFEMAMNHPGEMELLAEIVRPDIAVITNIGTAHIGLVGSKDAIAQEKKAIFSRFDGSQTGFVYEAEPYRGELAADVSGSVMYFGPETTPDYEGAEPDGVGGSIIRWRGNEIHVPLPGEHNVRNALAAISVGLHFGCTDDEIVRGLESVEAEFGRGEVIRGAVTIIQDSYNANADSMLAAIRYVDGLAPSGGKKVLVLGAMYELGSYAAEHHLRVARAAAESSADVVILFGEEFEQAAQELGGVFWTDDFESLRRGVARRVSRGDLVLLKGSRGIRLERLVSVLRGEERG